MVDGAKSECIPIDSGVPQGSVFGPLRFILDASERFELLEHMTMQMTPHYWQLLASEKTDLLLLLPLTARDLARIQEWCNQWRMILNFNKIKFLVVSGSRTVNAPNVELV